MKELRESIFCEHWYSQAPCYKQKSLLPITRGKQKPFAGTMLQAESLLPITRRKQKNLLLVSEGIEREREHILRALVSKLYIILATPKESSHTCLDQP